jgi:hypothetical protein
MDRLAALLDKAECTELVHKVARAIDRRDAALLATLFHPDEAHAARDRTGAG